MQNKGFYDAAIKPANQRSTIVSSAKTILCGLGIGKGRRGAGKDWSTLLFSLTVAGLLVALAPMLGMAGEAKPGEQQEYERGKPEEQKELEALKAEVASLRAEVSALQSRLATIETNNSLKLGPFIVFNPGQENGVVGPNITFKGANIHIVSGSGSTDDNRTPTGLGNLIIGYDEDPKTYVDSSPFGNLPLSPLNPGDRGGSHNLVIGAANRFTQAAFSGLVVGTANTIQAYGASVTGGTGNIAESYGCSVSGGFSNSAGGFYGSVSGGDLNSAGGVYSSVSGGENNFTGTNCGGTCGWATSVSGGQGNFASGNYTSVTGGTGNSAFDLYSSVTGGTGNTAGSRVTFEGGIGALVVGGSGNNAGGRNSVVIGGLNVTDNNDNSIQPKAPYP